MSVITHSVEFHVMQHWARFNALAWQYYKISESSYDKVLESQEYLARLPSSDDPTERNSLEEILLSAAFQTIVFSAMACEASIYDLAAIQLGDDYVGKYLDKLDLVSKWIVVPSLVCGKTLNEDGPAINSLRTLTRTRNALVHHKSSPAIQTESAIRKAEGQLDKIVQNTDTAFQTVVLLSLELNRLLKTPTGVLPFFNKEFLPQPFEAKPQRIEHAINRCREIDAKRLKK